MRYILPLLCLSFGLTLVGQSFVEGAKNKDQAILFAVSYGPEVPLADLADRFGANWSVGAELGFTPKKSKWMGSFQGKFFFGNDAKEDVLAGLRVSGGFIIGNERLPADIKLRMRGLYFGARVGRLFSLGKNPRAGIQLGFGAGVFSHRIRIQFDPSQTVNQLVGDYRSGYDRLVAGPAVTNFIGWYQLSNDGRANFFAGIESTAAFTTNQRDFDFATAGTFEESRFDVSIGFRAGLIIPFYLGEGEDVFYR
ncbi:MAG: hypothetical protein AAFP08_00660 [Bacteroidota bacterium]